MALFSSVTVQSVVGLIVATYENTAISPGSTVMGFPPMLPRPPSSSGNGVDGGASSGMAVVEPPSIGEAGTVRLIDELSGKRVFHDYVCGIGAVVHYSQREGNGITGADGSVLVAVNCKGRRLLELYAGQRNDEGPEVEALVIAAVGAWRVLAPCHGQIHLWYACPDACARHVQVSGVLHGAKSQASNVNVSSKLPAPANKRAVFRRMQCR